MKKLSKIQRSHAPIKAIVLAAGVGKRFGKATQRLPKCLIWLDKSGQTLLSRYLDIFRECGLKDIVLVVGHQKDKIKKACLKNGRGLRIRFIENKDYKKGSVLSLYTATPEFDGDLLIMDADVYFSAGALKRLLNSKKKTAFLIDPLSKNTGEEMMLMAKHGRPCAIAKKVDPTLEILGEATGIFKISKAHAKILARILKRFVENGKVNVEYEDVYQVFMKKVKVGFEKIDGFWTEMDFETDLEKIRCFLRGKN